MARLGGKVPARQIETAKRTPPPKTRARIRGDFIHAVSRCRLKGGVRWDTLFFYNKGLRKIDIPNPFRYSNKQVEDIINHINRMDASG